MMYSLPVEQRLAFVSLSVIPRTGCVLRPDSFVIMLQAVKIQTQTGEIDSALRLAQGRIAYNRALKIDR